MGGPGSGRPPNERTITERLFVQLAETQEVWKTRQNTTMADQIAWDLIDTARSPKNPCRFKAIEEILNRVDGPIKVDYVPPAPEPSFDFSRLSDRGLEVLETLVNEIGEQRQLTEGLS